MSKYKSVEIPLDLYAEFDNSPMRIRDELWRIVRQRDNRKANLRPEPRPESNDPDRHVAEVIHTQDEPTELQVQFIGRLTEALQREVEIPSSRLEASELINKLKAEVSTLANQVPEVTPKQKTLINRLLDSRKLDAETRREIQAEVDDGITRRAASELIDQLMGLPKLDEGSDA